MSQGGAKGASKINRYGADLPVYLPKLEGLRKEQVDTGMLREDEHSFYGRGFTLVC